MKVLKNNKLQNRRQRKRKRINPYAYARSGSLDRFLKKFPRALKALGTNLEIHEIESLVQHYIALYEALNKHEGKINALRILSKVYTVCQRFSVSCRFDPVPFRKSDSRGFPLMVKPFEKALRMDQEDRRCALCILQLYKLIRCKAPDYELNSIIETGPSTSYEFSGSKPGDYFRYIGKLRPDIAKFANRAAAAWAETLEEMFPRRQLKKRMERISELNHLHISTKNGPNGPALANAHKDYISIRESPNILTYIRRVCELTENVVLSKLIDSMEEAYSKSSLSKDHSYVHSRLSLKDEPGAKVRVFAIGDYFTQSALSGIHDLIFQWLKNQPEDGTFNQDGVSDKVKNLTSSSLRIVSDDLSKATDRIPVKGPLYEIASVMVGEDLADQWINLLIDRTFTGPSGENVHFAVGQPLGLKTSWGLLALWHHAVFRTSMKLIRKRRNPLKPDYFVIGDDSFNIRALQRPYILIVQGLCGVQISETKGFREEEILPHENPLPETSTINVAELAKRVYYNGMEITPISPKLIYEGVEYPEGLVNLLYDVERRSYLQCNNPAVCKLARLGFHPKRAIQLAAFPLWPAPIFRKGDLPTMENCEDQECYEWYSSTWESIPRATVTHFTKLALAQLIEDAINSCQEAITDSIGLMDSEQLLIVPVDLQVFDSAMKGFFRDIFSDLRWKLMMGEFETPGLAGSRNDFYTVESRELRQSIGHLSIINDWKALVTGESDKRQDIRTFQSRILKTVYNRVRRELKELRLSQF